MISHRKESFFASGWVRPFDARQPWVPISFEIHQGKLYVARGTGTDTEIHPSDVSLSIGIRGYLQGKYRLRLVNEKLELTFYSPAGRSADLKFDMLSGEGGTWGAGIGVSNITVHRLRKAIREAVT